MRATISVCLAVLGVFLALGCDGGTEPPPAATPPATEAAMSQPPDPRDLESAPASTAPLADAVVPATEPVAGLAGVPGPSPAAGPLDAPVRVYVFTDYQCPVCRRAEEPVKLLARTHPTDVLVVVKLATSPRHALADGAARAALAAFRQRKFWPYQDRLFVDQRALGPADLLALANTVGLDPAQFTADLDAEAVRAQVTYEAALAQALDLASTPSFVVNGQVQRGWGSYAGLDGMVRREIARAAEIARDGIPRGRVAYEATRRSGPDGPRLAAALFEPAAAK